MERHRGQRFEVEEAIQCIIEPGDESDLSELDDSDEEEYEIPNVVIEAELPSENESDEDPQGNKDDAQSSGKQKKKTKKNEHVFKWKSKDWVEPDTTFTGNDFRLPPDDVDTMTPLQYFKLFWSDDLMSLVAGQTNLYSVQKTGGKHQYN